MGTARQGTQKTSGYGIGNSGRSRWRISADFRGGTEDGFSAWGRFRTVGRPSDRGDRNRPGQIETDMISIGMTRFWLIRVEAVSL